MATLYLLYQIKTNKLKIKKMKPLSILLSECREANKLMSKYAKTNQIDLFVKWAEKVAELEDLIINYKN